MFSSVSSDDMINIKIKLFLLGVTLFFFLVLRFQGAALIQDYADKGIVSLELAASAENTTTILDGWRSDGLITRASNNILIDFLFIPFYAILFYTLTGSISVRLRGKASSIGVALAFFSLIAGLLDVLENLLMLTSIHIGYNDLTAFLTAFFAILKFMLLLLALPYILFFGSSVIMRKKLSPVSQI